MPVQSKKYKMPFGTHLSLVTLIVVCYHFLNESNDSKLQDILKDQWSPALTIKTALLSLQALMCSPEPGDPQDAQVATQYKKDRAEFDKTARFWTESYAKATSKEDAITRVCEMGFDRDQARTALEKHQWDESAAVNALLGGL